jgi:hypothetical protein
MNSFATYPAAALLVADQTVSDRVQRARARAAVTAVRRARRAERRAQRVLTRQTSPKALLTGSAFHVAPTAH